MLTLAMPSSREAYSPNARLPLILAASVSMPSHSMLPVRNSRSASTRIPGGIIRLTDSAISAAISSERWLSILTIS
ncbi:MAG: hypothetical protein U1E38_06110 [Rhodospirillales bacterium]